MSKPIVIGTDVTSNTPVSIDAAGRWLSTYVIGSSGMGKSTLLESIALQDMENGDGLCFIDPHGDASEHLLKMIPQSRKDDVIYWNAVDVECPFGLNPFECDPTNPITLSIVPQNFVNALESLQEFREVFGSAVRMKDLLLNLAHAFVANQGRTLLEAIDFLDSADSGVEFRKQFYPALSQFNPYVRTVWERFDKLPSRERYERAEASLNKLRRFAVDQIMRGIFGQPRNSINFRNLIDEGKILIVRVADIGEYDSAFIGAMIISGIWSAAQTRTDIPEQDRRRFHIIADEFQDYMTAAFVQLQRYGRKFGVDTIVAHQDRARLDDELKSTTLGVGNKIVFRVNGKDAPELARGFKKVIPAGEKILQQKHGYAVDMLYHLGRYGHSDERVVEAYQKLKENTDNFFEQYTTVADVIDDKDRQRDFNSMGIDINSRSAKAHLQDMRDDLEKLLNKWLYTIMTSDSDIEGDQKTVYFDSCNPIGSHRYIEFDFFKEQNRGGELYDLLWKTRDYGFRIEAPLLYGFTKEVDKKDSYISQLVILFQMNIMALAMLLRDDPLLVATGQYETIVSRPRTYADVEDEIADDLLSQPRYTAQCSLFENDKTAEHFIRTLPLSASTAEGIQLAGEIRTRSRKDYGRCGGQSKEEGPIDSGEGDTISSGDTSQTNQQPPVDTDKDKDDDDDIILRD